MLSLMAITTYSGVSRISDFNEGGASGQARYGKWGWGGGGVQSASGPIQKVGALCFTQKQIRYR